MRETSTELWFPIADLLPMVDHRPRVVAGRLAPRLPEQLLLMGQGRLRYLVTDAAPPLLVDALDPASVQRVYAVGYSYHAGSESWPADPDRHGIPVQLGAVALDGTERPPLISQLHTATSRRCDWLVLTLTLTADRRLRWQTQPLPHPAPAVQWRLARLEVHGLPGSYPGEFADNGTDFGWLTARFTRDVAEQIATAVNTLAGLPAGMTLISIVDGANDPDNETTVGVDPDGFWRVGVGWRWVSAELAPDGQLVPFTGPTPSTVEPDELPAIGQDVYWSLGCLMWLDDTGDLVVRTAYDDGRFDPLDSCGPPEYGNIDPEAEWRFRAAEHLLRQVSDLRRRISPLASSFSPAEVEQLLVAASHAIPSTRSPALTRRQLDLSGQLCLLVDRLNAAPSNTATQPPGPGPRS